MILIIEIFVFAKRLKPCLYVIVNAVQDIMEINGNIFKKKFVNLRIEGLILKSDFPVALKLIEVFFADIKLANRIDLTY